MIAPPVLGLPVGCRCGTFARQRGRADPPAASPRHPEGSAVARERGPGESIASAGTAGRPGNTTEMASTTAYSAVVEAIHVTAAEWRWGESNPRPSLSLCAFSGRSLCRRSTRLRHSSQTPKSTSPAWEESHVTSRRHHAASPLDDARVRSGGAYGLTDFRLAYAARAKSLRFASAIMFLQRAFTR